MSTIDTIKSSCGSRGVVEEYRATPSTLMVVFNWLVSALAKRRSRIHLSELSDDQLRDIGISKGEARQEVERRFWD
ncbi:DUF1127 domain-containing protein [Phyllobacterium sp. YR531]|uniref:DUF1127 domain-containing protein n=1 Tax=Phyllobacterium sp. YR531 TaxID=1144343 RepID=UPI00026F8753|nr:DUF1127 domain-containing protein [Phyllobacterium sp. YR531]EJN01707.1 hypothetical protein PMI41_03423 [Phyllobacterium sp. YR531]